ncbi:hypothetical protein [Tetragenococcus muriaticus]|uniref:Uncharacterized protein n=1 Tax=Tetragenococcus muriaticus 3MR10-3 TaxID=1302648 RepID=A0A091C3Y0_9ENTE|nr:hypothetical protein [Tetragenococcus muriaticus]KFN92541.1 hypothetical protein TMU3MR103_0405 [Tetragenococcus muriaticus 3MR10-3]
MLENLSDTLTWISFLIFLLIQFSNKLMVTPHLVGAVNFEL